MSDRLTNAVKALTFWYDNEHWFPFVESETADITGPGHQDKAAFAEMVNAYDQLCVGADDVGWATGDDVQWRWAVLDVEAERFELVAEGTPGAVPVTCMWGVR